MAGAPHHFFSGRTMIQNTGSLNMRTNLRLPLATVLLSCLVGNNWLLARQEQKPVSPPPVSVNQEMVDEINEIRRRMGGGVAESLKGLFPAGDAQAKPQAIFDKAVRDLAAGNNNPPGPAETRDPMFLDRAPQQIAQLRRRLLALNKQVAQLEARLDQSGKQLALAAGSNVSAKTESQLRDELRRVLAEQALIERQLSAAKAALAAGRNGSLDHATRQHLPALPGVAQTRPPGSSEGVATRGLETAETAALGSNHHAKITAYRNSARNLDLAAADLEDANAYHLADQVRELAARIRQQARELGARRLKGRHLDHLSPSHPTSSAYR